MNQIIILTVLLLSAGCSTARQAAIDISVEKAENIKTLREISERCKTDWLVISGFIKGALGSRMNELPNEAIEAIEELDRLAEQELLSDYELGIFLGLKVRLLNSVVQVALEKYAPDVVDLLPLVF